MMPETFKDKLLNYEVQPPTGAWEAISEELRANKELLPVSKKLYDFEVAAPQNTWKNIANLLRRERGIANLSPVKTRYKHLYKIMAAAAILGVIVISSIYITRVNNNQNNLPLAASIKPDNKDANLERRATGVPPVFGKPESEEITSLTTNTSSKPRKHYRGNGKVLKNTKVKNPLLSGNDSEIMIAAKPIRNANGDIIQDTEIVNNSDNQYISITGPNGQQTKISSKFLHMLLFINDDSDIDEVDGYFDKNFLESLVWKSRFQDWRNKIINTSLVPSSTNFMDILEFRDLISNESEK